MAMEQMLDVDMDYASLYDIFGSPVLGVKAMWKEVCCRAKHNRAYKAEWNMGHLWDRLTIYSP